MILNILSQSQVLVNVDSFGKMIHFKNALHTATTAKQTTTVVSIKVGVLLLGIIGLGIVAFSKMSISHFNWI